MTLVGKWWRIIIASLGYQYYQSYYQIPQIPRIQKADNFACENQKIEPSFLLAKGQNLLLNIAQQ
jgi:hypothetical protein